MLKLLELLVSPGLKPVSKVLVREEENAAYHVTGATVAPRFTRGNFGIRRGDRIVEEDLGPPNAPSKK